MPSFISVLESNKYKTQVTYTKINRDKNNKPSFTDYTFHANSNYIYPASTVKLPVSLLALIKTEELNLNRAATMITDSAFYCQKKITRDSSSASGYPTIENYIKKMFLVSDNLACARTYEFVGYDYAHQKLRELGFKNIRLFNRLDGKCPGDTSKITPPVYFLNDKKDTAYKQGLTFFNEKLEHPISNSTVGESKSGKNGYKAKNFSAHNYFTPSDLHLIMKKIVFNESLPSKERLPLSNENRKFMLKYLGMYPRESEHPKYDKKIYYDSYKKYFIYGNSVATIKEDSLRIFNIVGRAYGFLIDCAYIVDFKNKIEFLLTSCVYVNERGVIGSGKYEYDQIGLPFLKNLSLCLYHFERKRKKEVEPDLKEFRELYR
ncbi:MAG: hypothetical protein JWO32_1654 [Bacteroidetes bacterium]|nr:hypothetical protein [Bacteroidota bacterium]